MFAKLVITTLGLLATKGGTAAGKVAATLIPYQVYLTPALVMVGCGIAFYVTNQANKLNLILGALIVVNEALFAAEIQGATSPPAKS